MNLEGEAPSELSHSNRRAFATSKRLRPFRLAGRLTLQFGYNNDKIQWYFGCKCNEIQPLMNRKTEVFISDWQQLESRKPLVLRGARQVGTTYLVQHWGKERFRNVLTVDFGWERD